MSSRRVLLLVCCLLIPAGALAQQPGLDELRQQVSASPEDGSAWYAYGRALQDVGDTDAAIDAFEKAIGLGFQAGGGHLRIAQLEAARGNRSEALNRLDQAAAVSPMVISFLPQIGGIPELEGHPRVAELVAAAERELHPCHHREEAAQFDFWLGSWVVTNPQGQPAGENVITKDLEGCVIRESWISAFGNKGTSVNFYDPRSAQWHQIWTSDNGTVTHYHGTWSEGAMRFEAGAPFGDVDGETRFRRMTFTPQEDGSVRQLIEDSTDGENWTTGFDGIYRTSETQ